MTQVTAQPAPVSFTTEGMPDEQRIERWEGHNEDALIGLRCRTLSGEQLEATETNLQLDRLHLARVSGTSHVVERDADCVRRRPTEAIAVYFGLSGQAFYYDEDGARTAQPGQALICDADRPFLRGFSQGLEELVLKVPREVFTEATGVGDLEAPVTVDFGSGRDSFAHALARHVGGAVRDTDPAPADEAFLLELLTAVVAGRGEATPSAHLVAARTYIDRHLRDPGLSAARVADAVGVSPRHLSRVFADAGESVPRHILGRRLDLARRQLERPETADLDIAEIARLSGFVSASHFSRAFVERYGERPGDVRRGAARLS